MGVSGLGVYQVVAHAYRETIDQGLESVTNVLHESIEPVWQQPGQLKQLAKQTFFKTVRDSGKLLVNSNSSYQTPDNRSCRPRKLLYAFLLDRSGSAIALAGLHLEQLPVASPKQHWQTLNDRSNIRYRQITLPLYTKNKLSGYMQVGRSLKDLDKHLAALRLTFLLGAPITIILIGICSWWLAGLAMQPVYRSYQQNGTIYR